jgi:hypothetical protein
VTRLTFLSHFVICLAIAAGFYFAWRAGIPQMVAENIVGRWFGGVIGTLFVWTAAWLGLLAWFADDSDFEVAADFGHLMQLMFPAIGMLGTVVGLSLSFRNAGTPEMMAGAATAFYSTGCGILAMILTMAMTYSLECGIARARR